ncbi:MAG: uroporphyrinogen-III synthase [Pseudomonadota bacterium]|uniref:uroporphyrinogen-III synthase n=1 Tax=Thermithiobacillus tepidarius TaxID=929 RepID=UPI000418C918|nr:uroporphyrinogen-III synthase [Thermithiobacillus tepidarius]
MESKISSPLQGKGIVVTRPKEQAGELIAALEARGARPIVFPAVRIERPASWDAFDAAVKQVPTAQWAIFVSRNAVTEGIARLKTLGMEWPAAIRVAATGRETAKELEGMGIRVDLVPQTFNAESLLAEAALQDVAGQDIVLFAGDAGRDLLPTELTARGARVHAALCYKRVRPSLNPTPLLHKWARAELHAVTVTSPEIFNNFYEMVGGLGQRWLKKTPIVAISPLTAAAVEAAGLPAPIIAPEASGAGLIAALEAWAAASGEEKP